MHQHLLSDRFQKNTKNLFKGFLFLVEDLHVDHTINFDKLYDSIPEEYHPLIHQADYMDEKKMAYLRKKILDIGNDTIRNMESELDKFTIHFKF